MNGGVKLKYNRSLWFPVFCICLLCTFVIPVVAAKEENAIKIENKEEKREYYNKEGKLRLVLSYQYPEITGQFPGIKKINETIIKQKEDWFLSHKELIETSKEEQDVGFRSADEVTYLITYNENGMVSILEEGYLFTGGAHGMPYRMPNTFSLETGQPVTLPTLLGVSDMQIKALVEDAYDKLMKNQKDWYWPEALQVVKETKLDKIGYYLTDEGVIFYFDPYILAPYAAGFVEAKVPLP